MKHRELHQQVNKSQSDIHPSKGWLEKQERQQLSENEENAPGVARSGLKFNFLDVPVQREEQKTLQRSPLNPQTWPHHVLQKQKNANSQGLDKGKVPNLTGLPDRLKAGVEHLSGYSMDHVRVHYNSPKPLQLQALAYTQGTDIHVAPGQEKHLSHETWHVVQQMQGRVKPTMQMKGVQINDDQGLEKEADVMGAKAFSANAVSKKQICATSPFQFLDNRSEVVAQRKLKEINRNITINNYGGVLSPNILSTSVPVQLARIIGDIHDLEGVSGSVHWHYLYDDTNINSLHLTVADKRNYSQREWASRRRYTPTGTDSGIWSDWANNYGNTPVWAIQLVGTQGLDSAQEAFYGNANIVEALQNAFPEDKPDIDSKEEFPPLGGHK
ncbi:MAG: DUF4157 domain-containing protein [Crocosphaera sp.]|nr:DUF4157 domain-containing protein [Crocosphaera sp.]